MKLCKDNKLITTIAKENDRYPLNQTQILHPPQADKSVNNQFKEMTNISPEVKKEIIEKVKNGEKVNDLASKYGKRTDKSS